MTDAITSIQHESADQLRLIRESATAFLRQNEHLKRTRMLRDEPSDFSRDMWNHIANIGWTSFRIPQEYEGGEFTIPELIAVTEETGRVLLPDPLIPAAILGGGLIVRGDNEALKRDLLPRVCRGQLVPVAAWQEGLKAVSDLPPRTQATLTGDCWTITGEKRFVRSASGADGFIVSARTNDGTVLFWVERNTPGVDIKIMRAADGAPFGDIGFNGVMLKSHYLLASSKTADGAFREALNDALLAVSGELVGLMKETLSRTLNYLRTRKQFGQAIGSFQALQHRVADLFIAQQLSTTALDEIAFEYETSQIAFQRSMLASRAKARCSAAALRIAQEAIQLHGGIGYTDEHDIGLFLKRALVLSSWLGNASEHRARFSSSLDAFSLQNG